MKIWLALFLVILLAGSVHAQKYISAKFEISENGFVSVSGESDANPEIPGISYENGKISGQTQTLTGKQGEEWTFFLDIKKEYEAISINIYFPDETKSVNNITANSNYNINLGEKISIEVLDYDKKIYFKANYKIENRNNSNLIVLLLALAIAVLIVLLIIKKKRQVKKIDVIKSMLNEQEEKIVKLLEKRAMKQKEIRKILDIPKASFSRYMYNLEKKRIIKREGEGKNKIVSLK